MRASREKAGSLLPTTARRPIDDRLADRGQQNGEPLLGADVSGLVARVSFEITPSRRLAVALLTRHATVFSKIEVCPRRLRDRSHC